MYHDQGPRKKIALEENKHNGKDSKQKQKFKENNGKRQEHESLTTKVYQKSDRYLCSGARNFFPGGAEKYTICEQFFKFEYFA